MKISAKTRYGLSALTFMAALGETSGFVTVSSLSEKLSISKIYLEQVFAQLKRGGVVVSTKGSSGGYKLARRAAEITLYDVFSSTETALFSDESANGDPIAKAVKTLVTDDIDKKTTDSLKSVTLADLTEEFTKQSGDYMFYL